LGIRRLNHHHLHAPVLLQRDRLILIGVERTPGKGVLTQRLNRRHHRLLVGLERLPQRGIIVKIFGHHVQHCGKIHQRNESRIEALLLRRICQRLWIQVAIAPHPQVHIMDLLRIR
jgi:hypothetical protein